MTFGSLFSGIGGFDRGLELSGMECRWQVEVDQYASRVLAARWPSVPRWGDVVTFPPDESDCWKVDAICAGPPCQPISQAGHRRGTQDERWMWGECLRVVATLKPKVFVAENPAMLLRDDGGRTFSGIVGALAAVGYVSEWHVLNASSVGAPHRRRRVYVVAYSDEQRRQGGYESKPLQGMGEAWHESAGSSPEGCGRGHSLARPAWNDCCVLGRRQAGQYLQALPRAARLVWPTEPELGRVAHGVPNRVDRLRCLGNAVVPQVAELIGRAILQAEGMTQ
jgi:DNA (cytosine-5)-methyltransferase 1